MKLMAFGDNAATIGGKRVPYSLLGALAAILGAFLIWKFNQSGGLGLGTMPDLSSLGGGGGGGSADLGSLATSGIPSDLIPGATTMPSVPIFTYGYAPASSPIFDVSAASAPSTTRVIDQAAPNPYPGQLGSVAAFAPIAPSLGGLLPGILTPARAPAPTPAPVAAIAGPSLIAGINRLVAAQPPAPSVNPIRTRSSGSQALA